MQLIYGNLLETTAYINVGLKAKTLSLSDICIES